VAAVAFYISGHGFGHLARQVEIINVFARRRPDVAIFVRSTAARWLLDRTIEPAFELDDRPTDTGVVQIDSLQLDPRATIEAAATFYATLDARADAEAAQLQARAIDLVISDAPPLACAAAARAGMPSVVACNFTWDWIYAGYAEYLGDAPSLLPAMQSAYRLAREAWRMPLHGGFEAFDVITDVPFVARRSRLDRGEARDRLGLSLDRRLVLPSFGGYGISGLDLDSVQLPDGWEVVRGVQDSAVYDAGLKYQDLVRAVDVVMTKPGYGIVSECIANGTALVYTSRGRFAEYDVFVGEMPRYLRCAFIDNEALLAGRWRAAIERAYHAPAPPERPATNGAETIAAMIEDRVSS